MTSKRPTYKEQGIVLHSSKYGERKLIVYMLTASHGRRSYILNVNKSATRALFQPLYLLEFTATSSASEDGLHSLKEPLMSPPLRSIPSSPIKAMIVMTLSELLYRVAKESDEAVYNFTKAAILALESLSNDTAVANFHIHFMVHFSALLGYAPSGDYYIGDYFDIKESAFCRTQPKHTLYMKPKEADILYRLLCAPYYSLDTIKLSGEQRRHFLDSMIEYYGFHNQAIFSVRSISILGNIL